MSVGSLSSFVMIWLLSHLWILVRDYPNAFNSLVGKKMLFKIENKAEQGNQVDVSYPVRKICTDETIMAMFQLPGTELSPTKAMFAPPFPNLGADIDNLHEPYSDYDSQLIVSHVSLSCDGLGNNLNVTPCKRKLDEDFTAAQDVCSISGTKVDHVVDVDDDIVPDLVLGPLKIPSD